MVLNNIGHAPAGLIVNRPTRVTVAQLFPRFDRRPATTRLRRRSWTASALSRTATRPLRRRARRGLPALVRPEHQEACCIHGDPRRQSAHESTSLAARYNCTCGSRSLHRGPRFFHEPQARPRHLSPRVARAGGTARGDGVCGDRHHDGRPFATDDLAAVGIGASIYFSVFVALMGVLLAVSPIVAQLLGAGRDAEIGEQVRQGMWLTLALDGVVDRRVPLSRALPRAEQPVTRGRGKCATTSRSPRGARPRASRSGCLRASRRPCRCRA